MAGLRAFISPCKACKTTAEQKKGVKVGDVTVYDPSLMYGRVLCLEPEGQRHQYEGCAHL